MEVPPPGVGDFDFNLQAYLPVARVCLELDPGLAQAQIALVRPGRMSEDTFWRFFMFHLSFIVHHEDCHDLDSPTGQPVEQELQQLASASEPPKSDNASDIGPYALLPEDFVVFGPREVHGYLRIPESRASGYAAN